MAERTPEAIARFDQDIAASRSIVTDLIAGYRAALASDGGDHITAMNWLLGHLQGMPSMQDRQNTVFLLVFAIYQLVQDQVEGEGLAALVMVWEESANLSRNTIDPVPVMRTRMLDQCAAELRHALGLPPRDVAL